MLVKTSFLIKASIVCLTALSSILAVELYGSKKKQNELQYNINLDKKLHNNDIQEILNRYDSVLLEKKNRDQKTNFVDSAQATTFQNATELTKNKSVVVPKNNTSKEAELHKLNNLVKKKQLEWEEDKFEIEGLYTKINNLQSEINTISTFKPNIKLKAVNVNAMGIQMKQKNQLETQKIKNIEHIKVSFTLEENNLIEKGNKNIFIQIINPNSKVVNNNNEVVEIMNKTLFYSARTIVNYDKNNSEVSVFVETNSQKLIKGDYRVNIFSGINLIGNTNLTLL